MFKRVSSPTSMASYGKLWHPMAHLTARFDVFYYWWWWRPGCWELAVEFGDVGS